MNVYPYSISFSSWSYILDFADIPHHYHDIHISSLSAVSLFLPFSNLFQFSICTSYSSLISSFHKWIRTSISAGTSLFSLRSFPSTSSFSFSSSISSFFNSESFLPSSSTFFPLVSTAQNSSPTIQSTTYLSSCRSFQNHGQVYKWIWNLSKKMTRFYDSGDIFFFTGDNKNCHIFGDNFPLHWGIYTNDELMHVTISSYKTYQPEERSNSLFRSNMFAASRKKKINESSDTIKKMKKLKRITNEIQLDQRTNSSQFRSKILRTKDKLNPKHGRLRQTLLYKSLPSVCTQEEIALINEGSKNMYKIHFDQSQLGVIVPHFSYSVLPPSFSEEMLRSSRSSILHSKEKISKYSYQMIYHLPDQEQDSFVSSPILFMNPINLVDSSESNPKQNIFTFIPKIINRVPYLRSSQKVNFQTRRQTSSDTSFSLLNLSSLKLSCFSPAICPFVPQLTCFSSWMPKTHLSVARKKTGGKNKEKPKTRRNCHDNDKRDFFFDIRTVRLALHANIVTCQAICDSLSFI